MASNQNAAAAYLKLAAASRFLCYSLDMRARENADKQKDECKLCGDDDARRRRSLVGAARRRSQLVTTLPTLVDAHENGECERARAAAAAAALESGRTQIASTIAVGFGPRGGCRRLWARARACAMGGSAPDARRRGRRRRAAGRAATRRPERRKGKRENARRRFCAVSSAAAAATAATVAAAAASDDDDDDNDGRIFATASRQRSRRGARRRRERGGSVLDRRHRGYNTCASSRPRALIYDRVLPTNSGGRESTCSL